MPRRFWLSLVLVLPWLLLAHGIAGAEPPPPDCSNPRSAADSLFIWLRPDSYDPKKAKQCLDVPPGANGERLAVQLKQILDARALYVPIHTLSTSPDYVDDQGEHKVVPMPDTFPMMVLERNEAGQWLYSQDTLEEVPDLYRQTFSALSVWFQKQLPSTFYTRVFGLHLWQYLYGAILVLGAWVLGQVVRLLLRGQVRRLVRRAGLHLDAETYARTNGPITATVITGTIYWGLTDLQLPISVSVWMHKALSVITLGTILLAMSRFIDVGAGVAASWAGKTESKLDDQLVPLIRQAAQILLMVVGGLYLADALGIDVWKLAAGVGIGGLAFALAAQDTVANVFGSVNIFVDKPFQIGDWVVIGEVEGIVEEVGFRSTRVRTFYNSLVTIPNSRITNANVDNYGLRSRRRVRLTIRLTYDTPAEKIQAYVEGVRAVLAAHPKVQRSYEVHVYDLGPSAVEILVYYHVVVANWTEELTARSQNLLEFIRVARELGVSFALPSNSVYIASTPERPLTPETAPPPEVLDQLVASFGPGGSLAHPHGPPLKSWNVQAVKAAEEANQREAGS